MLLLRLRLLPLLPLLRLLFLHRLLHGISVPNRWGVILHCAGLQCNLWMSACAMSTLDTLDTSAAAAPVRKLLFVPNGRQSRAALVSNTFSKGCHWCLPCHMGMLMLLLLLDLLLLLHLLLLWQQQYSGRNIGCR